MTSSISRLIRIIFFCSLFFQLLNGQTNEITKTKLYEINDIKYISALEYAKTQNIHTIFYEDKSDYVQIGGGKGFFHLVNDKANLGTEKFHGNFILRFRAKRHTTKNFHSYSFFATLACKRVTSVSKYNIEETLGQKFPPIRKS